MFSINPFVYDYDVRPKTTSFGLFHDYPFSNSYYVKERQPSLFRSSSFRRPQSNYYQQPAYQQSDSEDDEHDPFLNLFNLRSSSKNKNGLKKSNEIKQQLSLNSFKELDSTRYDTDEEIIFKFNNYECNNPSDIEVKITKDNYILLKTSDGFKWRNRIPDDVAIKQASCTVMNNCLSLKIPKIKQIKQCDLNSQVNLTKKREVKSKNRFTKE